MRTRSWERDGVEIAYGYRPQPRVYGYSQPVPAVSGSALAIGFLLIAFQLLDGLLTTVGVTRFGHSIEGNPLLRHLIELYGCIPALALFKSFAILVVVLLVLASTKIPWVKGAMGAITFIYLVAAIVPWTYVLFVSPLL